MRRSDTPELLQPDSNTAVNVRSTPSRCRTEPNTIAQIRTRCDRKNLKKPEKNRNSRLTIFSNTLEIWCFPAPIKKIGANLKWPSD